MRAVRRGWRGLGGVLARPVAAVEGLLHRALVQPVLRRAERLPARVPRSWRRTLAAFVEIGRLPLVFGLWALAYVGLMTTGGAAGSPDGAEVTITAALTLPLLLRRRAPLLAWALMTAGTAILFGATHFWSPVGLGALLVVLHTIGARHGRRTLATVGTLTTGSSVWLLTNPQQEPGLLAVVVPAYLAALTLGDSARVRRLAGEDLATREEQRRQEQARRALLEERSRIARELHDVVAHHMSVIAVQSETARYRIPGLPPEGVEDFAAINATARRALVEMRRLLGVLRDETEDAGRAPQPGLHQVEELLATARAAGLDVTLSVEGIPRPLPPGVDLSAFRIVQEAVTNARRHAGEARVAVRIGYEDRVLRVSVRDDGPGTPAGAPPAEGHGLLGMRERVAMLGGELAAGPGPGVGFAVEAALPLDIAEGREPR